MPEWPSQNLSGEKPKKDVMEKREWKIWKTIEITEAKDAKTYLNEMKSVGVRIGDYLQEDVDDGLVIEGELGQFDLIFVSVQNLGFARATPLSEIIEKAILDGLSLCSARDAFELRLEYIDQSQKESLTVAMNPIISKQGSERLLEIENESGLRFDTVGKNMQFGPGSKFIFRVAKH